MKIEILYSELVALIEKKFNVKIEELKYIAPSKIHLKFKAIRCDIEVVERRKSSIDVALENMSIATSFLIQRFRNITGVDQLSKYKFAIRFGKMDSLSEFFETMELKNLEPEKSGIIVELKKRDVE